MMCVDPLKLRMVQAKEKEESMEKTKTKQQVSRSPVLLTEADSKITISVEMLIQEAKRTRELEQGAKVVYQ
jgi:hypothetical protein